MKKVILLLVEGPSDEDALLGPTRLLVDRAFVSARSFHTDVTTASLFQHSAAFKAYGDVVKTVREFIVSYLDNNQGYGWADLAAIVHVVDLDGALVRSDAVVQDATARKVAYGEDEIRTCSRDSILERNRVKRAAIKRLCQTTFLSKGGKQVPYRVFFMSRNLEHALYGIGGNLSGRDKERLASAFAEECYKNPGFFLERLRSEQVAVPGDYDETWNHCFKGTNSLHRGSNYHLLFDMAPDFIAAK